MSILAGIVGGLGALTGLINTGINVGNYNAQKETNKTNVALTREGWAREDNAVQRRTADLKAAGLNPVLAAGQAATASAPVRLGAPQMSPTVDLTSPVQKGLMAQQGALALMQAKANISKTASEQQLIEMQKGKTAADTAWTALQTGARSQDVERLTKLGLLNNSSGLSMQLANLFGALRGPTANAALETAAKIKDSVIQKGSNFASEEQARSLARDENAKKAISNTGKAGAKIIEWYNNWDPSWEKGR